MGHSTLRLVIVGYGVVTATGSTIVASLPPPVLPALGLATSAGAHPPLTIAQMSPSKSTARRLCTPCTLRRWPFVVRKAPTRVGARAQAGRPHRTTYRIIEERFMSISFLRVTFTSASISHEVFPPLPSACSLRYTPHRNSDLRRISHARAALL